MLGRLGPLPGITLTRTLGGDWTTTLAGTPAQVGAYFNTRAV